MSARTRRCPLRHAWIVLVLLACGEANAPAGNGGPADARDDAAAGCEDDYPAAPAGAAALLHVSAACGAPDGDGSTAAPHASIAAAVAAAAPGTAILVAPGAYAENLVITVRGLAVVAREGSVELRPPAGAAGIVVAAANDVSLDGLHVVAPEVAGIWVRGGSATVRRCAVEGARSTADLPFGYGLLATDGATVTVDECAFRDGALVGVMFHASRGAVRRSAVTGNARGGVRLESCPDLVELTDSAIDDNAGIGVAVLSSRVRLEGTAVRRTTTQDDGTGGHGVVVAPLGDAGPAAPAAAAALISAQSELSANAGVGVLYSGAAAGEVADATIQENRHGGVWLQDGAGSDEAPVTVTRCTVTRNHFVGVGATTLAHVAVSDSEVRETALVTAFDGFAQIEIGDGIGVFGGARARIEGNELSDHGRAGVLLDSADGATLIAGNDILRNAEGLVVQHPDPADPIEVGADDNHLEGNGTGDVPRAIGPGDAPLGVPTEARVGLESPDAWRGLISPGSGPPE